MFGGFNPLDANFTMTPNQFFDEVVGRYPSRVVTVVAILIRATLGWRDPITGERRVEAALPLSAFLRPDLCETSARKGLDEAIQAGFLVRTASSDPRTPARYALKWKDESAQREAIERARRAAGDPLPLMSPEENTVSLPPPSEDATVDKRRGSNFRPPEFRGLKNTPPINKVLESKRKDSYSESNKLLNVDATGSNPADFTTPNAGNSIERLREKAIQEVVSLTGDSRSLRRFRQLFGLALEHSCLPQWDTALRATQKRMQKSEDTLDKPGAYFCKIFGDLLLEQGVYVPTGTRNERTNIRGEIERSLGIQCEKTAPK